MFLGLEAQRIIAQSEALGKNKKECVNISFALAGLLYLCALFQTYG